MANEVFSYSVNDRDIENMKMVNRIKDSAKKHGISMSWIVLTSLRMYERAEITSNKQHMESQND